MIKKVTIRQIAEFCGVSKSAVARALANEPEVAPTVRREILTAARNLGYTGKQRRGPLRIAVLTSGFEYGMYRSHMECAVRQALHQAKLRCLVLNEADRELFRELSVDGVISLGVEDRLAHFWNNLQGIPLVCINDYGKYTDRIYAVSTDREASNRMMVDYLTRMGHRNIGLIRRDAHYSPRYSHARHEGFYQAMKEKHLSDRAYFESFFDPKDFPGCVKNMLENPVTAIIILGEGYAAQAIMELEKLGKRVPEDISLLAQGIPHFSEYLRPPLSSIQQDFSTLAGAAVKLMLRLIRREPGLADIWVPPLLLPGKSVLRLS